MTRTIVERCRIGLRDKTPEGERGRVLTASGIRTVSPSALGADEQKPNTRGGAYAPASSAAPSATTSGWFERMTYSDDDDVGEADEPRHYLFCSLPSHGARSGQVC